VGFLEVVLGELRRAGLVDSKRGGQGGYWLARPPDTITVADVIRVLDGESPSVPTPQGSDELAPVWRTLVDGYMDAAEQITVAGLVTDAGGTSDTEALSQ
jgi:Rrf2 family protein